jgi:hypothetical protein
MVGPHLPAVLVGLEEFGGTGGVQFVGDGLPIQLRRGDQMAINNGAKQLLVLLLPLVFHPGGGKVCQELKLKSKGGQPGEA